MPKTKKKEEICFEFI